MALPKVHKTVQDQQGNIVPQVLGSVFNQGTGVLAALYQDDAGTVPLSNPLTSDATYGSFKFYINPGHYDLTFTKPGYTFEPIYDMQVPQDTVTLGTMATQNANAVAITGGQASNLALVGIGISPGYPLDVVGGVRVQGNLGLHGSPAADAQLRIMHRRDLSHQALIVQAIGNDGSGLAVLFNNVAQNQVGSIYCSATGTAFNTSSDGRLKEAIAALPEALQTILALRPVQFRWTTTGEVGQGFVAQEVAQVVPQAVSGSPDDPTPTMQMDATRLIPYLVGACHELAQQVQALTARLAVLEAP